MELKQVQQQIEASDADLSGSTFYDVKLAGAVFSNVNLAGSSIQNANLARLEIKDASLALLQLTNCDLRNAAFTDCLTDGVLIDGIPLSEMMAAYRTVKAKQASESALL
jgi:uncharacterized protein YjbI with pentapeptide repeats